MTEEIINSDGSRNWEANILLDNIKRLEQENKELKRDNKRMKAIFDGCGLEENGDCTYCNVDEAYHELEQENKELKKDVQLFKCLDTFGENECHCACRCLGNEFCEDADKKINSYRSALEEIRILATKNVSIENFVKIQNRINEVLNDN